VTEEFADQRTRWDQRHAAAADIGAPAEVLLENPHLLPARGVALDLACGRGANALWLAEHTGLEVHAWDFSPTGVERLQAAARARGLRIATEVRDVVQRPPQPATCDVLVVTHFLERAIFPALREALRPGGLLLYQTFTRAAVSGRGPSTPEWRLARNELLSQCAGLIVRAYREEGTLGDTSRGLRDLACLVAERPT
jgi:cyclopropane fatty-acyl-phospholipid synthase-like methyltransferase